jgi:hypothetical protein
MSRKLMVLVPAALVLALGVSGAAIAGSADTAREASLYERPNPFAAVETAPELTRSATTTDQRIDTGAQRASTATFPQTDWSGQRSAERGSLYHPE